MGQFDSVDLGSNKTMLRMIAAKKAERDEIIEACANVAALWKHPAVADEIRKLKDRE